MKGMQDALDYLEVDEAKTFQQAAGCCQYFVLDRLEEKFAVKEVMQGMARPQKKHLAMLKRVVRFMKGKPNQSYKFEYGQTMEHVVVIVDGDWAGDKETRRSSSAGIEFVGDHIMNDSSSTQATIALSSTESEYNAMVLDAGHGILTRNILRDMGYPIVSIILVSDRSGARGVAARQGVGKIRHLDVRTLWLQQRVKDKEIITQRIATDENVSDLGTKHLTRARLQYLTSKLPYGMTWGSGIGPVTALMGMILLASAVKKTHGVLATMMMHCSGAEAVGAKDAYDLATGATQLVITATRRCGTGCS